MMNPTVMTVEELDVLSMEISKKFSDKIENDLDLRRGELAVKQYNAVANMQRNLMERRKLDQEEHRLKIQDQMVAIQAGRLYLDERNSTFAQAEKLIREPNKFQRLIGKTMLTIWPEQDKTVLKLLKAAQDLKAAQEEE